MAASSTRSKPAAKKAASKAKPAKATSAKGKVSSAKAKTKAKTSAKATPKKAAAAKKAAPAPRAAKPEKVEKPAKAASKAKVEAKVETKPKKTEAPVEAKPAKKPARAKAAEAPEVEVPAAKPAKKPAKATTPHEPPSAEHEDAGPAETAAALEPPAPAVIEPPAERKKSVLEIAEEDDEFDDEMPLPTLENLGAVLDRIHQLAQFGGESEIREELPPLVELLEQIEDPSVLPRLLDLLEDTDPHGVYWNVLYVLEKFDQYLKVLLDGLPALYHRAPEWAYTCVIRILRTRGDEDDCTAAFEQLINSGPADTRALMSQILRELSEHPETDEDQRQNIARTITAIGGDVAARGEPQGGNKAPEPAPEAAS